MTYGIHIQNLCDFINVFILLYQQLVTLTLCILDTTPVVLPDTQARFNFCTKSTENDEILVDLAVGNKCTSMGTSVKPVAWLLSLCILVEDLALDTPLEGQLEPSTRMQRAKSQPTGFALVR